MRNEMTKNNLEKTSMKRKILYLFILFGLTLSSCKKDDCSVEENNKGLISRISKSGVTTVEYAYLCSGLLNEVRTRYSYSKYTYNSIDLLEKRESYEDPNQYSSSGGYSPYGYGYGSVEWTDPKDMKLSVTELFKYYENKQLESYSFSSYYDTITAKFNYNEQGLISKQTVYSEDSKPTSHRDFIYDESGNLTKEEQYLVIDGTSTLYETREYEFDQMHNPFLVFRIILFPGTPTNQNNIIKETHTFYGKIPAGKDSVTITNHVYEYNELGYPIKMDNDLTIEYN
ncbi:MAG: hypothetical protein JZU47_00915 [Prolixibacteraceae bacterium]|nr:hypothetical protein [Prolixibacteraceae bacterium]